MLLDDLQRGFALFDAGRYGEAAPLLRAAVQRGLARGGDAARVLVGLGLALARSGHGREAVARLRQAAKAEALDADVSLALSNAFVEVGETAAARVAARRAVALDDAFADAHLRVADLAAAAGDDEEAGAHYGHAIALEPRWTAPLVNRAAASLRRRRIDAAVRDYEAALAIDPGEVEAKNGLGAAALAADRIGEAAERLRRASVEHPAHAATRLNLGRALRALGDVAGSIDVLAALAAAEPANAEARDELARGLALAGRDDEALATMRVALSLAPRRVDLHVHLANLLAEVNALGEAAASCRRALAIDPRSALARWNLALIELAQGDHARGWADYEARWGCAGFPSPRRDFDVPAAKPGQRLAGLRVLVHAEQGFGDTIQFLRYVPLLEAQGATVVLELQAPLVSLAALVPGERAVVARSDELPAFDAHVPMLSLPLVLASRLPGGFAPVASPTPYLVVSSTHAPRVRPRVALAWSGSGRLANDRRSLRLAALAPLLERDDIEWVGVQHEVPEADAATFAAFVERHPRLVDGVGASDFVETARRLADADLVVSIDTAVAHLAGALARPLAVLLTFAPDFRWMASGGACAWYPTATLHRQVAKDRWDEPVAAVRATLDRLVADR